MSTLGNLDSPVLRVKRLSDDAILPIRGSDGAAGYDLAASQPTMIPPGGRSIVPTDLAIACPVGTYGRVAPRSGLTVKYGIHVGAGVVDADYRGPVGVVLFNLGNEPFHIAKGDRIAQLILEKIVLAPVQEVDDLDDTVRGGGGFGSTGIQSTTPDVQGAAGAGDVDGDGGNKKARVEDNRAAITPTQSEEDGSHGSDNDATMDSPAV